MGIAYCELMSGFVQSMSEKLKSPSIITLDIGEGMDRISAGRLLIITLKASAGHDNNNKSWFVDPEYE